MMLAILIFWQTEGLSKFPEWIHRKNTQIMLLLQNIISLVVAIVALALLCLIIYCDSVFAYIRRIMIIMKGGESLAMVQERNIEANRFSMKNLDKTVYSR